MRALGATLPAYAKARIESADFTQITPVEYRADLVVLLSRGKPVYGIVVEVQLKKDKVKHYTWPLYAVALRARFRCPVSLLVVAPRKSVAAWAGLAIELGGDAWFRPHVLGAADVSQITDAAEACASPELAVLSAIAHGKGPYGARVGRAAILAARQLPGDAGMLYYDLVKDALGPAAKRALEEELMNLNTYVWKSEPIKTWIREGLREAKEQGLASGVAEGRAQGVATSLREVLDARGLTLSDAQAQAIDECVDLVRLRNWLRRALSAAAVNEVFAD